jgi:hypothetical protein
MLAPLVAMLFGPTGNRLERACGKADPVRVKGRAAAALRRRFL